MSDKNDLLALTAALAPEEFVEIALQLRAERDALRAENERLRAERDLWRERFHQTHVNRGEWFKACPLCEPLDEPKRA